MLRLFVSISIRIKAEIDFNWKNIDSREFAETFYHEKSQKHEFKKKNELFFQIYTQSGFFYGKSFRLESFREAGACWKSRALWVLILRQTKQHNDFINGVVNFDTE